jgi:putative membrane protein
MRTGVAVIAFGFLIDRFDLFVLTMADAVSVRPEHHAQLERISQAFGLSTGVWFILVGVAFIVAAAIRFVPTRSLLKDEKVYKTGFALEFALAIILAALIVIASTPLLATAL